ncbi:MAG: hypothetical protein ABEI76_08980 [Halobacteriales archaeon]
MDDGGTTYAGKNWEPGTNNYATIAIKSPHLDRAYISLIGVSPDETVDGYRVLEQDITDSSLIDIQTGVGAELYDIDAMESLPPELEGSFRDVIDIWGGTCPTHNIGAPSSSAVKPVVLLPSEGRTAIGNASHYNFDEWWGGFNDAGLFVQTAGIKHDNRLDMPTYSLVTEEMLRTTTSVDEAVRYLRQKIEDYEAGGGNFLIADASEQSIVEYVPGAVTDTGEPYFIDSRDSGTAIRTNFGLESQFFMREDWSPDTARSPEEEHHFIRAASRQKAAHSEADHGRNLFSSHTVYKDLFDADVRQRVFNDWQNGLFKTTDLGLPEQHPSFYSICSHPRRELSLADEDGPTKTTKRTFLHMGHEIGSNTVTFSYDNSCQPGPAIHFDIEAVDQLLEGKSDQDRLD